MWFRAGKARRFEEGGACHHKTPPPPPPPPPPEPALSGMACLVGGRRRGLATWTKWLISRCAGLRWSTKTVSGLPPKSIMKNLDSFPKREMSLHMDAEEMCDGKRIHCSARQMEQRSYALHGGWWAWCELADRVTELWQNCSWIVHSLRGCNKIAWLCEWRTIYQFSWGAVQVPLLALYGCPVKPTVVRPDSCGWWAVLARQTSDVGGNARPGHLPLGGMW